MLDLSAVTVEDHETRLSALRRRVLGDQGTGQRIIKFFKFHNLSEYVLIQINDILLTKSTQLNPQAADTFRSAPLQQKLLTNPDLSRRGCRPRPVACESRSNPGYHREGSKD